jgi:carboxylesterase type B
MWLSQIATALLCCSAALAVDPVVDLGYSRYQGRVVGDGTTQWKGMRYAAPPLGKLRFAKPQDPLKTKGIQDASEVSKQHLATNTKEQA